MSKWAKPQIGTPPKPDSVRPRLLASGLDSLYVSYYLNVPKSGLDLGHFDFLKEKIKQSRDQKFAEVETGSERFALMPYGSNPYRYLLQNDAFAVRLAEHMQPGCNVQFYSEALWNLGLEGLLARFDTWCESVGLIARQPETVGRADWAFDYDLPEVDFSQDHFVTRATKDARHREHGITQTFTFGTGDIVVRVYDKVAEIEQQSGKTWFHELWGQCENVWRIEFQARKTRLRLGGIETVADLKSLQNDLLRELATNHTSLRRPNGDTNRSRWPLHPLWEALLEDIAALPQTGLVKALDPQRPINFRIEHQAKSLYGNLKSLGTLIAARDGLNTVPKLEHVLEALPVLLKKYHWDILWKRALEDRLAALKLGQW